MLTYETKRILNERDSVTTELATSDGKKIVVKTRYIMCVVFWVGYKEKRYGCRCFGIRSLADVSKRVKVAQGRVE